MPVGVIPHFWPCLLVRFALQLTFSLIECRGKRDGFKSGATLTEVPLHQTCLLILRVYRKRAPIIFNYSLKGHTLKYDESTKYLGVEILQDMSWKLHIDKKKGNSTIGFLRKKP